MLTQLEIENFRCIASAELGFDAEGTGIVGANASGKTSLLESIFFLSHGRSFRSATRERLLRHDAQSFRIVGHLDTAGRHTVAGLEFAEGELVARLGGADSSMSDIARMLPAQIIDPGVHRLIEEGSARRRRLLDWGVFHVKHHFLTSWRRYQRALRQRNAALRNGESTDVIEAWEAELASSGAHIDQDRAGYLEILRPHFERMAARLLGCVVTLGYRRGWPMEGDLAGALQESRARDVRLKTTSLGAHRADLLFRMDGEQARDRVSRGQQKMLAAALILAQVQLRSGSGTERPCLLLDDPAAELDVDNLGRLLGVINEIPAQIIATSVTNNGLKGMRIGRMFHVEQGNFAPML